MRWNRVMAFVVVLMISFYLCFQTAWATPKSMALAGQARSEKIHKAVPGQLSYQGYLIDAADSSAVMATLPMTFRLFDSETKGAQLWSETHPAVEVGAGLFQVLLGSQTAFPDGLFDGSTLWLQTEIGAEVLTPRKPLASAAYSHRANSAEMLLDYTLTDLDDRWVNEGQANGVTSAMVTDGEIVDDDVAPGAAIDPGKIAGTAWTADNDGPGSGLNADMVDGHQAADFIAMDDLDHLDAADGDPTDAVYVDDDGKVGIGITPPDAKLHIRSGSGIGQQLKLGDGNQPSYEWLFDADASANLNISNEGGGSPDTAICLKSNGNVGIGTATPGYPLDVSGAVNADTYYGDGSHLTGISGTADADWTISGDDVYHETGNVGIGTTNPQELLDTPGTVRIGNPAAGFTAEVGLGIIANDATSSSIPLVVINPDIDQILYARGDGKVGIGTSAPGSPLEVSYDNMSSSTPAITIDNTHGLGAQDVLDFSFSGAAQARIRKANSGDMFLGTVVSDGLNLITNDVNRLTVTSNGQIGVGTNSPDYLFDVAGDAGFDEYLYHNGDEDTYVRFTSDQVDLYAGDVWLLSAEETTQDEVVVNEGSADVDFRVESDDNSYAFWVRGSDGNVGVGTSSLSYKLNATTSEGTAAHFQTTNNSHYVYGCYGIAEPSGNYDAGGVYGVCEPADHYGYGVFGKGGYIGVYGRCVHSAVGHAAYGVFGYASGGSTNYGVYYSGGLGGSGSKSAIVRTQDGPKAVYCQESPENWFEDFGSGEISGGRAEVQLASDFRQTITVNGAHPLKVFITPNARLGEWWVEKGTTGFTLMAPEATDGAKFDYRVAAKRRGYEDIRLVPTPAAYADHFLYPDVNEVPAEYQSDWLKSLPAEEQIP